MNEVVATGTLKSGEVMLDDKRSFAADLKKLKDGSVLVRVERAYATRSVAQSRYYWGVVVELLSDHTGYTPDEIHELLKAKFIPKRLAIQDGNGEIKGEYVIGGTTTKLTTKEFSDYCGAIQRWAAEELGVVIPDPNETDTTAAWWDGIPRTSKAER